MIKLYILIGVVCLLLTGCTVVNKNFYKDDNKYPLSFYQIGQPCNKMANVDRVDNESLKAFKVTMVRDSRQYKLNAIPIDSTLYMCYDNEVFKIISGVSNTYAKEFEQIMVKFYGTPNLYNESRGEFGWRRGDVTFAIAQKAIQGRILFLCYDNDIQNKILAKAKETTGV